VSSSSAALLAARAITWGGVALFWIVQLSLMLVGGLPLVDSILLAVLLAAVPTFSLAQVPLMEGAAIVRLPAYWGSIVTLWILGTASWLVGTRVDGPSALGLVWIPIGTMAAWSLGLAVAGMLVILLFRQISVWARVRDSRLLWQLLPRTPEERRLFALLSVAAGAGEELAYRGYAIPVLAPILGVPGAAALTTLVFGIIHGYQGRLGILRTWIMGGILAWGFLESGSLWPPIIAHTLIDLLAGIVFGERLLSPEGTTGVQTREDIATQEG
jgi:membrane protease YdiL (CAAX protease family)